MSALFTSESDEWGTPIELFCRLDRKWNFSLDPCASRDRPLKEDKFQFLEYHKGLDGLSKDWSGSVAFVNPPYSEISKWVEKAASHKDEALIVMLIPARTDTIYWHKWIEGKVLAVEFLGGRLRFARTNGEKAGSAPFPSCLVYF